MYDNTDNRPVNMITGQPMSDAELSRAVRDALDECREELDVEATYLRQEKDEITSTSDQAGARLLALDEAFDTYGGDQHCDKRHEIAAMRQIIERSGADLEWLLDQHARLLRKTHRTVNGWATELAEER